MRRIDLTGQTFGRWTVCEYLGGTPQGKWRCTCACGEVRDVTGANLRSGHSTSCGKCTRSEYATTNASRRDFRGAKNPRARAAKRKAGADYTSSSDVWYKRAAGVFYSARRKGTPMGFDSAMEFAAYVKAVAPAKCPVFNRRFTERGSGFSPWSPSIDKIIPTKGYVRGNVQVISMLANAMKRDATAAQLRRFAEWVLHKGHQ
jgi:hypothetical protein